MTVCAHFTIPENELASGNVDLQSGNEDRGICGLPFTRQSDNQTVYIPMNIIGSTCTFLAVCPLAIPATKHAFRGCRSFRTLREKPHYC